MTKSVFVFVKKIFSVLMSATFIFFNGGKTETSEFQVRHNFHHSTKFIGLIFLTLFCHENYHVVDCTNIRRYERPITMIDCMVFNAFQQYFNYRSGQCTYPCFPGILLTSTPHNILCKPLAAFPHNIVESTDSGTNNKKKLYDGICR